MFESKVEFFNWLSSQNKFSLKLNLQRIVRACELLGNPQNAYPTIHIAGTNGKGSTLNYLSRMLEGAGFKVGIFISPYIISFNERIQINHEFISDEALVKYANLIYPIVNQVESELQDELTEFEIITLIAFVYFKDQKLDYAIFEVGLGGRYDATNVLNPLACGITNISYDHMGVLGNTLEKIAFEKIGIAKSGVPVFTTEEKENVLEVFKAYCENVDAKLIRCDKKEITNEKFTEVGMQFSYKGYDLSIPMLGFHQVKNVHLALNIYEYLMKLRNKPFNIKIIKKGLNSAKWRGRLEIISKKPLVLVDGSHNIDGVKTLIKTMNYYLEKGYTIHTIFAALKDKDTFHMLEHLQSISNTLTLTSFDFYRASSAKNLYEQTNKVNVTYNEDFLEVLNQKIKEIKDNELLLVTGSLYFIAKVISYFSNRDRQKDEC